MSKRSKHEKVQSVVVHDAEVQIPGLKQFLAVGEAARSHAPVDLGLPPYSPLTQDELTQRTHRLYGDHEHDLLVRRISNQRRELRHLNRAYRRRESENARRIVALKEQVRLAHKSTEERNRKIEDQQREIDYLNRRIRELEGRKRRSSKWPLIG